MNLEERILNIAEAPAWYDSRELSAIALEVRKREDRIKQLEARIQRLEDCAETAWGIIANVNDGSWQEQRADWREAATRWRDEQFHPELSERKSKEAKP